MAITLPTAKVAAERLSPKVFIMYSLPKTGKTTLLSKLDNCLIIDLEDGSKYLDALKVNNAFFLKNLRLVSIQYCPYFFEL